MLLNDLFEFELDPAGANLTSTDLSAVQQGTVPSARTCHGFSSLLGKLYVHGGSGMNGELSALVLKSLPIVTIIRGTLKSTNYLILGYFLQINDAKSLLQH
jgi:hypothetical protein